MQFLAKISILSITSSFAGWTSGRQEGGVPLGHHHRGGCRGLSLLARLAPRLLLLLLPTTQANQTVSPLGLQLVQLVTWSR